MTDTTDILRGHRVDMTRSWMSDDTHDIWELREHATHKVITAGTREQIMELYDRYNELP